MSTAEASDVTIWAGLRFLESAADRVNACEGRLHEAKEHLKDRTEVVCGAAIKEIGDEIDLLRFLSRAYWISEHSAGAVRNAMRGTKAAGFSLKPQVFLYSCENATCQNVIEESHSSWAQVKQSRPKECGECLKARKAEAEAAWLAKEAERQEAEARRIAAEEAKAARRAEKSRSLPTPEFTVSEVQEIFKGVAETDWAPSEACIKGLACHHGWAVARRALMTTAERIALGHLAEGEDSWRPYLYAVARNMGKELSEK